MDERQAETTRKQVNAAQRRSGLSWEKVLRLSRVDRGERRTESRAQLIAKKGASSGRMQRLTELVPIPTDSYMVRERSVKAP